MNDANVTGVNFTATAIPTYSISGTISPSGSGATVTLSGAASARTTADGSGNYSFSGAGQRQLHRYAQQERLHVQSGQCGGDGERR